MKEIITARTIQKEKEEEGKKEENIKYKLGSEEGSKGKIVCTNEGCPNKGGTFNKYNNYSNVKMQMCPVCKGMADEDDIEELKK